MTNHHHEQQGGEGGDGSHEDRGNTMNDPAPALSLQATAHGVEHRGMMNNGQEMGMGMGM